MIRLSRLISFKNYDNIYIYKVLDCGIEVSQFDLQSSYYVHFWTNIPLISPAMGWIVSLLFFYKEDFGIE